MISSGIGAGLIVDGRPYRGAEGLAGEIGHVLVDADGPDLPLRQPRLPRDLASGTDALADLLRRSHGDGLTGATIVRLAREGDLGCRRAIADAGRAIGQAVATLVQRAQPRAADRRRRPRRGGRAPARRRARVAAHGPRSRTAAEAADGRRRRRSASAPRCSARSRSSSQSERDHPRRAVAAAAR